MSEIFEEGTAMDTGGPENEEDPKQSSSHQNFEGKDVKITNDIIVKTQEKEYNDWREKHSDELENQDEKRINSNKG